MKKIFIAILALIALVSFDKSYAQQHKSLVDLLNTIDPDIKVYFPRWRVCELDLQIQIYQAFNILGYDKKTLDKQKIEILAAPQSNATDPYEILTITCGLAVMTSSEVESKIPDLADFIAGAKGFRGFNRAQKQDPAFRDYCYNDIPAEVPVSQSEASAIINYFENTKVTHSVTISAFEQSLKIGESGFWLKSSLGTDQIGYHFWSSGEARIVLKRPLYINKDVESRERIPYLINAYLGGGYQLKSGLAGSGNSVFSWVPNRKLNTGTGGKLIAGLDLHMPFHPNAGISFNAEIPLKKIKNETIYNADKDYATIGNYVPEEDINTDIVDIKDFESAKIAPFLRATGQVTGFYNWWLDPNTPENFLRIDLGLNYNEVQDVMFYDGDKMAREGVSNLKTYKNSEFGDWIYAKVEFRNQDVFPFGCSFQYSNQIALGRVYIPLIGNWFYIEGKYSTPLRGARYYENRDFFMISPVLRLTI